MEPQILEHEVTGSGDPLVLIPGGLTGFESFDPIVPRLSDAHQVIRVQPIANGSGIAGIPGDPSYSADVERESLKLTMDRLLQDQPFHIVGWSNGGRAALAFALVYQDRIRTVTAVEPAAWWLVSQEPGAQAIQHLAERLQYKDVDEAGVVEFLTLVRVAPPGTDLTSLPQWPVWRACGNALSWFGEELRRSAQEQIQDIEALGVPVLLLRGTWTAPWLRAVVDVLSERLPNVRVGELEGGHACLLQSLDDFVSAVKEHVGAH